MVQDLKRLVALAAARELPESGVIGLGTGSTTRFFIDAVGELVRSGRRLVGVCTSEKTRSLAISLGIPLLADEGPWEIDMTVDGADEVDASLRLSKGGGGALTREKIVNASSRRNVIICDETKRVEHIGQARPIAIEILPFGSGTTTRHLGTFGRPVLRLHDGSPYRSDGGNYIVDLSIQPARDPAELDRAIRSIPGVVETGLFINRADLVLLGVWNRGPDGVAAPRVERLTPHAQAG
jgi:ribose 5-phosphate isomerase A